MHQPGDHIDIWVVEKALGSGGMGSVYRCHNRTASRILAAIKVLESGLRTQPEAEARFIREAEILFQLDHPNIVKVRNVRIDSDPPYLEMEFVEGESLEDRLQRGPLDYDQSIEVMRQCASALEYLHLKGVRHRDIKPANLVIHPEGLVKLVDFGLAVEMNTTRITQHGMAFGTVSYAPPEWIAPERLDATQWDIYALGTVFFEVLTSRLAFPVSGQGSARQQAMQVIVGKQGHPPLDPGSEFPAAARRLIGDMTHSDAAERIADMADVTARLRQLTQGSPSVSLAPHEIPDRPIGTPLSRAETTLIDDVWLEETPPRSFRSRAGMAAAVVLGLAGVTGLAIAVVVAVAVAPFLATPERELFVLPSPAGQVEIRVSGAVPIDKDGAFYKFGPLPVRRHEVRWATGGERCTVEACFIDEDCPDWCSYDRQPIELLRGKGHFVQALPVYSKTIEHVTLHLDPLTKDVAGYLDEVIGTFHDGELQFSQVPLGNHLFRIEVGACRDGVEGCWPDGACPAGCIVHESPLAILGDDDSESLATLAAVLRDLPEPSAAPDPPVPEAPRGKAKAAKAGNAARVEKVQPPAVTPAPEPPEPAVRIGPRTTIGDFAAWLAKTDVWHSDSTYGKTQGDLYLYEWTGATPPPNVPLNRPMKHASWRAARVYCQSLGKDLPSKDAAKQSDDAEWRVGPEADVPWAIAEGTPQQATADWVGFTFFRCTK